MSKKLFALVMVVVMLCLAFAGCAKQQTAPEGGDNEAAGNNAGGNAGASQPENTVDETLIEGEADTYDAHAIIDGVSDKLDQDYPDGLRVCFVVKVLTNPFFVAMEDGVKEYVREQDEQVTMQCDNDAATMLTVAETAAEGDYDIILMTPINSEDIAPIEKAYNNGALVVLLDTTVVDEGMKFVAGTVCTDNFSAGKLDGEAFIEFLKEKYDGDVHGKVAIFENPQGIVTKLRIDGFEDAISEYVQSGDIEVVYREVGKGQVDAGLTFMEGVLQRFSVADGGLDGVMSMNDPSAQGCAAALKNAGFTADDCAIFGVDGADESLDYIEQGIQKGTALQYPGMMAARGLAIAYQKLAGVELSDEECFLEISTSYIDKTNCKDYRGYAYIGD